MAGYSVRAAVMSDIMLWKPESDLMGMARSRALLKASTLQMTPEVQGYFERASRRSVAKKKVASLR